MLFYCSCYHIDYFFFAPSIQRPQEYVSINKRRRFKRPFQEKRCSMLAHISYRAGAFCAYLKVFDKSSHFIWFGRTSHNQCKKRVLKFYSSLNMTILIVFLSLEKRCIAKNFLNSVFSQFCHVSPDPATAFLAFVTTSKILKVFLSY